MGLVGVWTGFLDGMDFIHDSRDQDHGSHASTVGSFAWQGSAPSSLCHRLWRKLPGPHTRTLCKQLFPFPHRLATHASPIGHPTLHRYRHHPAPIPTMTALTPSLSAYFHLRPVFHPFTRHNNLLYIHILPRLPLSHNNINANDARSKAAGIGGACVV